MDGLTFLVLAAAGAAAGFVSTLFGIGGGIVMVPAMHYLLGVEWGVATGLSLGAIAIQSPYGIFQHLRRKSVAWGLAWPMAVGGLAGVGAGIWLEPRLEVPTLKLGFALLMAFAAYRMLRPSLRPRAEAHPVPLVLVLGFVAGVLAKLFGIGGGLLTVPILALLGTPVHLAVGSSLVPVFTNAATATGYNLAHGLSPAWAAVLGVAALATVPLGAKAAHALPEKALRRAFAAALALAAVYVALTRHQGT